MVMSRDQNAGRRHNVKADNKSFETVKEFRHLGTKLTNQNSFQEKINSRLNQGMLIIIRCRIFCFLLCYPKI